MSKLISKLASTSENRSRIILLRRKLSLYSPKSQWLVSLLTTKGMVYLLTVDCISTGFQQLIKRALKF